MSWDTPRDSPLLRCPGAARPSSAEVRGALCFSPTAVFGNSNYALLIPLPPPPPRVLAFLCIVLEFSVHPDEFGAFQKATHFITHAPG